MTVAKQTASFENEIESIWVYDDGVVKGFIQIENAEVKKLFVEPALQGNSIGAKLLEYAIAESNVNFLWALEKNTKAIAFYKRHGFNITNDKKYETSSKSLNIIRNKNPLKVNFTFENGKVTLKTK